MSDSLKKIWLKKYKNLLFSMSYKGFFVKKKIDSLIPSFLVGDVSKSLRSLTKNERCERIAQVAHQKWATMSESLRLLTKNERLSKSLVFLSKSFIRSFFRKKTAIRSKNWLANSQPWRNYTLRLSKFFSLSWIFSLDPVSHQTFIDCHSFIWKG